MRPPLETGGSRHRSVQPVSAKDLELEVAKEIGNVKDRRGKDCGLRHLLVRRATGRNFKSVRIGVKEVSAR
jgi:hypothetical protein